MYALIAAFILATTPAWAQDFPAPVPLLDKNGVKAGTVTTSGNRQFVRNAKEELIGVIVIAPDGKRTVYDPNGNVINMDKNRPKSGPQ